MWKYWIVLAAILFVFILSGPHSIFVSAVVLLIIALAVFYGVRVEFGEN